MKWYQWLQIGMILTMLGAFWIILAHLPVHH